MTATASQVGAWLLVEVSGQWGSDAIGQSELAPHAPAIWREAMRRRGVRVVAIRRDLRRHPASAGHGARLVHVLAARPGAGRAQAWRRTIDDLHELVSATESIAAGHDPGDGWEPETDRYVLVCTNGRHDPCCAVQGRPLVRDLRNTAWADQIWECSHIGGCRFAANLVVLPDSLYFGRVDAAAAHELLGALDEGRLPLERYRGRSTLRLPEQAAEHVVRRELGVDGIDDVRAIERLGGARLRVDLEVDGHRRRVEVALRRSAAPAGSPLTCHGADGERTSTFHLVELVELDERDDHTKPDTARGV